MDFKANDQVVVRRPQAHGNLTEMLPGSVVSVQGNTVKVSLPGEFKPVDFPKEQVQAASDVFGVGANFQNPREMPIKKMYR